MARSRKPKKLTAEARSAARDAAEVVTEIRVRKRTPSDVVECTIDDHAVTLPAAVLDGLAALLKALAVGEQVVVAPADITIGTEETARLLGVSRRWAAELIDDGTIVGTKNGSKRRVTLSSLVESRSRLLGKHQLK